MTTTIMLDTIPHQSNSEGTAVVSSVESIILSLSLIATFLFLGLTFLNKFPHIFNYPMKITPENAVRQYTMATRLIRFLRLFVVIIFGIVNHQFLNSVKGEAEGYQFWLIALICAFLFIPVIVFIAKSYKHK